jgi:hypothetical protein
MAAVQQDYLNWEAALAAAGLDAGLVARLEALRPGERLSL